jgi:hypothetical protein
MALNADMPMESKVYRLRENVDHRNNTAAGTRQSTHGALATGLGASPLPIVELRLITPAKGATSPTWGTAL